jgi:nicotinamidase-related amidase
VIKVSVNSLKEKKDTEIALVVIDMQRKFMPDECTELIADTQKRLGTINEAIKLFRDAGRPVIFVKYDGPPNCVYYPYDDGDEFVKGLDFRPGDTVVHKDDMNSFKQTELADTVRTVGCESVLLTGLVAQYCVISSYYGAYDFDIVSYLLKGGVISNDEKNVDAVEILCKSFTLDDVKENIDNLRSVL